jgi:hypothetical protein
MRSFSLDFANKFVFLQSSLVYLTELFHSNWGFSDVYTEVFGGEGQGRYIVTVTSLIVGMLFIQNDQMSVSEFSKQNNSIWLTEHLVKKETIASESEKGFWMLDSQKKAI